MIALIQTMCMVDLKTAENHYYYICKSKQLPILKIHEKLQIAQWTTTKRINFTTEKLLHRNGTYYEAMEEMEHLNYWHTEWYNTNKSK